MSSVKKVNRGTKGITGRDDERTARELITGSIKKAQEDAPKKPILIRFDLHLLERVDTAARRRAVSRSAWIQFTLSRALDQGEG